MHHETGPEITVVIPVKDERDNVRPLLEELREVLDPIDRSWEVLVVDDGSTDGTWETLCALREEIAGLRLLRFRENRGQSAAFWAGLQRVGGPLAVMMDGDMQNDPHDIPNLLERIDDGADVCLTWRANRQDSWSKKIQSRIGNGFRNFFLKSHIRDTGSQLRAFRTSCLRDFTPFNGMHRFMGNLFLMRGCRVVQVPTNHRGRRSGKTKYGLGNRAWRGLMDLIGVRWLASRCLRYEVSEEDE